MELGWKFWIRFFVIVIGVGLAATLAFALIGWAWYAWGLVGGFIIVGGILLLFGHIYDRREAKRRESLA
jgi:bacteriorhodopsin